MTEKTWYEWRVLHSGDGKTPNVRINTAAWFYKDHIWITCGSGSGLGKSSEVWKFNIAEKSWDRVHCTGDPPRCRDGHTGTYIGNGRFVIFGGQGFPEPNLKLGRESESMKTKTYNKREVYNDLLIFNCDTAQWSPLYPDGLSIPMGRRAHSAVYIPSSSATVMQPSFDASTVVSGSTYQSTHSSAAHTHSSAIIASPSLHTNLSNNNNNNNGEDCDSVIPSNSLLVFGGVGIELSKYTEQLYNELWVFSFDSNSWLRIESRGIEPRAMYDHRMERVDDTLLLLLGGITGASKIPAAALNASPYSDVMLFNTKTVTWSYLKIYDHFTRPLRFNFHGFAIAADRTDSSSSSGEHSGKFYIFGGRQVVDAKFAATSRSLTVERPYNDDCTTLVLNVNDGSLLPADYRLSDVPEDRYGHLGVCASASVDMLSGTKTSPTSATAVSSAAATAAAAAAAQKKKAEAARRRSTRNSFLDSMTEVQHVQPLMFVFGGSSLEGAGFCDPLMYQLVRVVSTGGNNDLLKLPDATSSAANSAVVSAASSAIVSAAGTANNSANNTSRIDSFMSAPVVVTNMNDDRTAASFQVGFADHEDFPSRPNSPQIFDSAADAFGQVIGAQNNSFCSSVGLRTSIWNNLQNKISEREKQPREPANWSELKLALSPSLSQRAFLNKSERFKSEEVAAAASRGSTASTGERRSTASGSRGLSSTAASAFACGGDYFDNGFAPGSLSLHHHHNNNHSSGNNNNNVGSGYSSGSPAKRASRIGGLAAVRPAISPPKSAFISSTSQQQLQRPKSVAFSPPNSAVRSGAAISRARSTGSTSRSGYSSAVGSRYNNTSSNNNLNNNDSSSSPYMHTERRPYTAPAMGSLAATNYGSSGSGGRYSATLSEEEELERQLRIRALGERLKPVVQKKSKIAAKKEFLRLFPHTMAHVPTKKL